MINITEEYINKTAPNQNAITNGLGLVKKNSFVELNVSEDETAIFGECKGSGSSNYITSVDFISLENPVFRCNCPSRQFPCKHALGLMYAYVNGKKFEVAQIPEDLLEKRNKSIAKEEKKKTKEETEPKKVNKSALLKKIKAQKEGLELLEKITLSITKSGLGTINPKTLNQLEEQAKQLGNYYIPGAQAALREFILLFKENKDPEKIYTDAVDFLTRLYSLCKKGIEYLDKRAEDPEMSLDTTSTLDEWLGHAWQLAELKDAGLVQNEVELVQLSFNSVSNDAKQEYVDEGLWINLSSGQIVETRNLRPYKAAKYITEDDSFFSAARIKELYVYPGDLNPRVRWEGMTLRNLVEKDYKNIKAFAHLSWQDVIKTVKNQIKNPLSSKFPVALLKFEKIGIVDGNYVMEGSNGQRIVLSDGSKQDVPYNLDTISLLPADTLNGQVILVRFYNNFDEKRLYCIPLSIIKDDYIVRLAY